jgi:hypothetical protein
MFKNRIKIIALGLMLLIAHGCGDRLEIANPNRLASGNFYKTPAHAVAAVDAIYNELITDGTYMRIMPAMMDGRSDEIRSNGSFPPWNLTAKFQIPTTEDYISFVWRDNFVIVSRANQALENVPNIPGVEEGLRTRLMGQAYFLRGFAYFNLTNLFEKPPLILKVPEGQAEFYPSNQNVTQADVYAQIQSDLTKAIDMLPVDYNSVTGLDQGQVGRATKGAANALMGKVLLYQAKYSEALPYLKAVIDGPYSLGANYADLFSQIPAVEVSVPERIFWAEFNQSTSPDANWGGGEPTSTWRQFIALTPTYSIGVFGDYATTAFLYNEMREEKTLDNKLDPRYHATILSYEPSEGYTSAFGQTWDNYFNDQMLLPSGLPNPNYGQTHGNHWIKKYTLAATGGDPFFSGINYQIIRLADVILMYAECLANTGNIPAAATEVQKVRNRANLPNRQAEFAAYTLPQFMEQLAHERIMELAIEGSRFYDVRRWGWLDNAAKLAELRTNDPELTEFRASRKYLPIPQRDLDLNKNLVGNDYNTNF